MGYGGNWSANFASSRPFKLLTKSEFMRTVDDIFEMLDLFYAVKQLYGKITHHRQKKSK